jgi:hypothetical protein
MDFGIDFGPTGSRAPSSRESSRSAAQRAGIPIRYPTSYQSGFSDQMTPGGTFKPGTSLYRDYQAYKDAGGRADVAGDIFIKTKKDMPPRKRVRTGPETAVGASHEHVGQNFTLDERECIPSYPSLCNRQSCSKPTTFQTLTSEYIDDRLRHLARTAYRERKE